VEYHDDDYRRCSRMLSSEVCIVADYDGLVHVSDPAANTVAVTAFEENSLLDLSTARLMSALRKSRRL
jgi:hypothetical protein